MSAHRHAENMRMYAEDAAEMERPWERWEGRGRDGAWEPLSGHPLWDWNAGDEFRRKPKPLECWANVYTANENGAMNLFAFSSVEAAHRDAMDAGSVGALLTLRRIAIHMREVVE